MGNRIVLVFTILLACQLAGEVIARLLGLPVPGPVLGMVILFVALVIRGHVPDDVGVVTGGLLQNLSLLFVPAGVGVMLHAGLLVQNWLAVSAALMASVVITIAVTGLAMRWMRGFAAGDEPEGQP
ncbi:MAG: CidA/LrgA family protein [Caldilinea sp.]|nr:CidA/LrgA family protein [Caldilinea sp.]MCO5211161.1 CidA/LrgA family protein [Caldilinea sp.]MCW5844379.1 CidA/LrgA family protein [Caldilinea sp.]HRW49985.1 CidA/LrgA family protein [Caldilinea sp.]